MDFVSYADKNGFCYQPLLLNDDESWELFEKMAMFGIEDTSMFSHKPFISTFLVYYMISVCHFSFF